MSDFSQIPVRDTDGELLANLLERIFPSTLMQLDPVPFFEVIGRALETKDTSEFRRLHDNKFFTQVDQAQNCIFAMSIQGRFIGKRLRSANGKVDWLWVSGELNGIKRTLIFDALNDHEHITHAVFGTTYTDQIGDSLK